VRKFPGKIPRKNYCVNNQRNNKNCEKIPRGKIPGKSKKIIEKKKLFIWKVFMFFPRFSNVLID
jgi:hypothetical protein